MKQNKKHMGAEKLTWRCLWEATLKCSYRELPNLTESLSVNHRHVCTICYVKKIAGTFSTDADSECARCSTSFNETKEYFGYIPEFER